MHKTYYEMLGVSRDADSTTIKNAFRKLAKKYHPDINPGNAQAEKMFKDVNEAYSVLSDESKRARYDRELNEKAGGFGQAQSNTDRSQAAGRRAQTNPFMGFGQGFDFDACMGAGMKFEKEYSVGIKDIGTKNQMTNYAFLSFLEEIASSHSNQVGYGVNDIEEKKNSGGEKESFAAYDIDLFEKMLNSD